MLTVHPIPAFTDNYIWLLVGGPHAYVVDPGDAAPVEAALDRENLRLAGILLTHHHPDHVGGTPRLLRRAAVPVFGPARESARIPWITRPLGESDTVELPEIGVSFRVLEVPGHTRGHIAYHGGGLLFCGDTLFAAGCGRLFEGTPAQMYASLGRLAALAADTQVFCGHEYTLANLSFSESVEPDNRAVRDAAHAARARRRRGEPTLPSTIGEELRVNPFLRCRVPALAAAVGCPTPATEEEAVEVFAELRRRKDGFRPPMSAAAP